MHNTHILYKHT